MRQRSLITFIVVSSLSISVKAFIQSITRRHGCTKLTDLSMISQEKNSRISTFQFLKTRVMFKNGIEGDDNYGITTASDGDGSILSVLLENDGMVHSISPHWELPVSSSAFAQALEQEEKRNISMTMERIAMVSFILLIAFEMSTGQSIIDYIITFLS
mmetsp:Transcript_15899/g.35813  ORF Transcript_15899/g.35813 Transcript_15899/m.35813 type:complete len:158 (-) Transcript_15899:581-1054(-)